MQTTLKAEQLKLFQGKVNYSTPW